MKKSLAHRQAFDFIDIQLMDRRAPEQMPQMLVAKPVFHPPFETCPQTCPHTDRLPGPIELSANTNDDALQFDWGLESSISNIVKNASRAVPFL